MPLLFNPILGMCPQRSTYFAKVSVYVNFERDVFLIIYMHDDGRLCCSTSIEAIDAGAHSYHMKSSLSKRRVVFSTDVTHVESEAEEAEDTDKRPSKRAKEHVRKPHMTGLHGCADQWRSEAWACAMRAAKKAKKQESRAQAEPVQALNTRLNEEFAAKKKDVDIVCRTMGIESTTEGGHGADTSIHGIARIARYIAEGKMNFSNIAMAMKVAKKTVVRCVARIGRVLMQRWPDVFEAAVDEVCGKEAGVEKMLSGGVVNAFCVESFMFDEAEQHVMNNYSGDLDFSKQAVMPSEGFVLLYDAKRMQTKLLERSLDPPAIMDFTNTETVVPYMKERSWLQQHSAKLAFLLWKWSTWASDYASYGLKSIEYVQQESLPVVNEVSSKHFCAVHQLGRSRVGALSWFAVINPVYGLVNLWQNRRNKDRMRGLFYNHLKTNFRRVRTSPSREQVNYMAWWFQVMRLAIRADAGSIFNKTIEEETELMKTLRMLEAMCNGGCHAGHLLHHHYQRCCNSDEEPLERTIQSLLRTLYR